MFTWGVFFTTSADITRKYYRARNHKTITTVEITLLGLSGTNCHIPNTEVYESYNSKHSLI